MLQTAEFEIFPSADGSVGRMESTIATMWHVRKYINLLWYKRISSVYATLLFRWKMRTNSTNWVIWLWREMERFRDMAKQNGRIFPGIFRKLVRARSLFSWTIWERNRWPYLLGRQWLCRRNFQLHCRRKSNKNQDYDCEWQLFSRILGSGWILDGLSFEIVV